MRLSTRGSKAWAEVWYVFMFNLSLFSIVHPPGRILDQGLNNLCI